MNTDGKLIDAELSDAVLHAFYTVYRELGSGFVEGVYCQSLVVLLREAGMAVATEVPIEVRFRGNLVGAFRADVLIPGRMIIEVKAGAGLVPAHDAQLINYLKATGIPVGMLLNFGTRPQFRRKVH